MLRHENNPQMQPAAKVRVTPEELAAALSRMETRKEDGQRQADGTVPLGEAVQELGLNTTPEELLQEIEAGRARSQEDHFRTPVPKTKDKDDDRSFQSYSPENSIVRESWTLIKHSGQVYVRGWIDPISDQAMRKYGVYIGTWESDFIDSDPSHTSHNQITVPSNGLQIRPGGRRNMEFHAINIHLDKHAWEKWQP